MGGAMLYFRDAGRLRADGLGRRSACSPTLSGDERHRHRRLHDRVSRQKDELGLANGIQDRPLSRRHARVGLRADGLRNGSAGAARLRFRPACSSRWRSACLTAPPRARAHDAARQCRRRARGARAIAAGRWPSSRASCLGVLWLIDGTTKWSERIAAFWIYAVVGVALAAALVAVIGRLQDRRTAAAAARIAAAPRRWRRSSAGRCSGR